MAKKLENLAKQTAAKKNKQESTEPENVEITKFYELEINNELSYDDTILEYDKKLEEHKELIKNMTPEELANEEKIVMAAQDKWSEELKQKNYYLKNSVMFQGRKISRKEVGNRVKLILDKYECEMKYTLGMLQMYHWWSEPKNVIDYFTLNSTSRVLGESGMKFRGPIQWEHILIINEFLYDNNEEYRKDNIRTVAYGCLHNNIMDAMKLNEPVLAPGDPDSNNENPNYEILPTEVAEEISTE